MPPKFLESVRHDKANIYRFMGRQSRGVSESLSPDDRLQTALAGIAVTPESRIAFDTVKSVKHSSPRFTTLRRPSAWGTGHRGNCGCCVLRYGLAIIAEFFFAPRREM
jgi:hypothetical protein